MSEISYKFISWSFLITTIFTSVWIRAESWAGQTNKTEGKQTKLRPKNRSKLIVSSCWRLWFEHWNQILCNNRKRPIPSYIYKHKINVLRVALSVFKVRCENTLNWYCPGAFIVNFEHIYHIYLNFSTLI